MGLCMTNRPRSNSLPEGDFQAYETTSNKMMYITIKVPKENRLENLKSFDSNPEIPLNSKTKDNSYLLTSKKTARKPRSMDSILDGN